MYIATRRARLEARGAGFLVSNNSKVCYKFAMTTAQQQLVHMSQFRSISKIPKVPALKKRYLFIFG